MIRITIRQLSKEDAEEVGANYELIDVELREPMHGSYDLTEEEMGGCQ